MYQMVKYTVHAGPFTKPCPCSPGAISCGYYNLNLHTGCPFSCSYCILQTYLETKELIYFSNLNDVRNEIEGYSKKIKYLRIGTGELSDSLALDHNTNYSKAILKIFKDFPSVIFEFKTKSVNIKNLVNVSQVLRNIVVSWSMNPDEIITVEEQKTPSLLRRLQAMKDIQQKGYKIGIHLDPIIIVKKWRIYYTRMIQDIAKNIIPGRIAWISLGALRFPYPLRNHIFKYKNSRLFSVELIKGFDGKYRYLKMLRLELFQFILKKIRTLISREVPIYLCMEDKEAWEEILPGINPDAYEINKWLYLSVLGNQ